MKGIKILFGIFAVCGMLFSVNAQAQENANRDVNGNVVRGAYETNGAFDNIFISAGAGVNAVILHPSGGVNTWGNMGLALDLNVGKWWTPDVGARIGYKGLWNNAKQNFDLSGIKAGDKFGFHYVHADVLWNLLTPIDGYKETRFYNLIPYMSMGVLDVSKGISPFQNANLEYAAGPGILNTFRVSDRLNVNVDLLALVGKAYAYAGNAGGRFVIFPSATVGVAFNLGKTNFDRHSSITPTVIPVPFTTEQYNALADKVAALEAENAALKDKIAALENELAPYRNLVNGQTYLFENGTFTAVEVIAASPITLYFDCGSATLSQRELAHLEYFTNQVVDGDTKLAVNGYADKQTGSARRNQKLSEQRVNYVVNLLKKAGASEGNIETAAHGSTIQLFDGAAKNRVVTVEVK